MRCIGVLLLSLGMLAGQVVPWLQRELLDRSNVVVLARLESATQVSAVVQLARFTVDKSFKGGVLDVVRVGDLADLGRIAKGTPALLFLRDGSAGFVHAALEVITLDPSQVLSATQFMDDQLRLADTPASTARDASARKSACANLRSALGLARRSALHDLANLAAKGKTPFTWDDVMLIEQVDAPRDLRDLKRSLIVAVREKVLGPAARILDELTSADDRNRTALALQRLRGAADPAAQLPGQLAAAGTTHRLLLRMLLVEGHSSLRRAGLEACLQSWSGDPPPELFVLQEGLVDSEFALRLDIAGRVGGVAELPWLRARAMERRCREQALTAIARLQLAEGSDFLRAEAANAGEGEQGRALRQLITYLLSEEFRKAETLRRAGTRRY